MQQLSIGAFSRLTHLSVKTLRYYHEVGLIEPAIVDPDSGYRYYRPGQAPTAQLVRRFRDLGLPVTDVKAVLDAPDLAARDTILAGHLDRMREQLRQTEAAVDSLRRLLGGASEPVGITERDLPGAVTVSIGGRVNRAYIAAWWWESLHALPAIVARAGLRPSGPPGGLYGDDLFAARPASTCRSTTPRRWTTPAPAGSCRPAASRSRSSRVRTATPTGPTPRSAPTRRRPAATARARSASTT
jgi:DNA-binding transcriptional MerR regulator